MGGHRSSTSRLRPGGSALWLFIFFCGLGWVRSYCKGRPVRAAARGQYIGEHYRATRCTERIFLGGGGGSADQQPGTPCGTDMSSGSGATGGGPSGSASGPASGGPGGSASSGDRPHLLRPEEARASTGYAPDSGAGRQPYDAASLGVWQGPKGATWAALARTLRGGKLFGSGAKLQKVSTLKEAYHLWEDAHPESPQGMPIRTVR